MYISRQLWLNVYYDDIKYNDTYLHIFTREDIFYQKIGESLKYVRRKIKTNNRELKAHNEEEMREMYECFEWERENCLKDNTIKTTYGFAIV